MLELVRQALTKAFGRSVQAESRSTIITSAHSISLLKIDWDGEPAFVAIEVIRTAYPRDIHGVLWRLDALELAMPGTLIKLIAAAHLSPGAKSTLKDKGYAFFERSGSLF
ncbi:hypothetical protein PSQ33_006601, partial [Pseudomonas aeruginosa]|nr:hypothetical protein [Pseudomonas aeruginosa]